MNFKNALVIKFKGSLADFVIFHKIICLKYFFPKDILHYKKHLKLTLEFKVKMKVIGVFGGLEIGILKI